MFSRKNFCAANPRATLKHRKHYEAQLITYDVLTTNNGKVRDVRSLASKIKVLNGRVPGT